MNPGRLIRLVPTGELSCGIEVVEPVEVQPLTAQCVMDIADTFDWSRDCAERFARAIEQAHGIGRRLDA